MKGSGSDTLAANLIGSWLFLMHVKRVESSRGLANKTSHPPELAKVNEDWLQKLLQ